jgi:hypothetical protein
LIWGRIPVGSGALFRLERNRAPHPGIRNRHHSPKVDRPFSSRLVVKFSKVQVGNFSQGPKGLFGVIAAKFATEPDDEYSTSQTVRALATQLTQTVKPPLDLLESPAELAPVLPCPQ